MDKAKRKAETRGLEDYQAALRRTFREMHPISMQLVNGRLNRGDRHLKELLNYALENQTTTVYPYVFKYSFCNAERDGRKVIKLAAAVHLLQTSSFITDDIFDSTDQRYRHQAIHIKYDVNYAIIAAELLQSIALETISSEVEKGDFGNKGMALNLFNRIMTDGYLGQYLDIHNSTNLKLTAREYYRLVTLNVGNFFAVLGGGGALLANKPETEVKSLASFGHNYGMALQITDDIVDLIPQPSRRGKVFAADLKARRMRLPVIMALQSCGRKEAALIRNFFRGESSLDEDVREVAELVRKCGALEACKVIARRYLNNSMKSLSAVKSDLARERLMWLSKRLLKIQGLDE